jgi:hypothetical protein
MQWCVKLVTDIRRQITQLAGTEVAIKIKILGEELMSGDTVFGRIGPSNSRQILSGYRIYSLHHYI